jgi:hypothetical protein
MGYLFAGVCFDDQHSAAHALAAALNQGPAVLSSTGCVYRASFAVVSGSDPVELLVTSVRAGGLPASSCSYPPPLTYPVLLADCSGTSSAWLYEASFGLLASALVVVAFRFVFTRIIHWGLL